ncbi:hypothetical protein [Flavobacterium piscis]|uniref:Uncharacterized protein n=1 Tax=Flavobacterium piscis TaxID=1114874 RepID=A0ABU1Y2R0_9FLAO|nr:hypothetical protein [Flavobacterium piscis]MDR7208512.1 hypothetical protein [Flavobacterium piscis]
MTTDSKQKLIITVLFVALAFSLFFNWLGSKESGAKETSICNDFHNERPSTLKTNLIKGMISQYRNNQYTAINKSRDIHEPDAHSIWFDLDTIKKFIYHIERNVVKNSSEKNNKLGLRIYYAAYPELSEFTKPYNEDIAFMATDPIKKQFATRHTLVMIPTIFNKDLNGDVDFNPLDASTFNGFVSTVKRSTRDQKNEIAPYQSQKYQPMALSTASSSDAMARNHGNLIPPADPMTEAF